MLYVRDAGSRRMACTKPWRLFEAECKLGPEMVQQLEVQNYRPTEDMLQRMREVFGWSDRRKECDDADGLHATREGKPPASSGVGVYGLAPSRESTE